MAYGFSTLTLPSTQATGPRRFSVSDLDAMFDANILSRDERLELVEGEILSVNSQLMPHAMIKSRIARKLSQILPENFEIITEGSLKLSDVTLVDPDLIITKTLKIERRYICGDEVLLAIEVADTTIGYDLGPKALLYARAEIGEYWVVDLNGAQTWVHQKPCATGYEAIYKVPFSDTLKALDFSLNISVLVV